MKCLLSLSLSLPFSLSLLLCSLVPSPQIFSLRILGSGISTEGICSLSISPLYFLLLYTSVQLLASDSIFLLVFFFFHFFPLTGKLLHFPFLIPPEQKYWEVNDLPTPHKCSTMDRWELGYQHLSSPALRVG